VIPKEKGNLRNLKSLSLWFNKLTSLLAEIENLENLKNTSISNCLEYY